MATITKTRSSSSSQRQTSRPRTEIPYVITFIDSTVAGRRQEAAAAAAARSSEPNTEGESHFVRIARLQDESDEQDAALTNLYPPEAYVGVDKDALYPRVGQHLRGTFLELHHGLPSEKAAWIAWHSVPNKVATTTGKDLICEVDSATCMSGPAPCRKQGALVQNTQVSSPPPAAQNTAASSTSSGDTDGGAATPRSPNPLSATSNSSLGEDFLYQQPPLEDSETATAILRAGESADRLSVELLLPMLLRLHQSSEPRGNAQGGEEEEEVEVEKESDNPSDEHESDGDDDVSDEDESEDDSGDDSDSDESDEEEPSENEEG